MGTWLQFRDSVKAQLTIDKDRLGLGTFIDDKIKHAVEDILFYVTFYRKGQESTFTAASGLTADGSASKGTMPEGAAIQDGDYYDIAATCSRKPLNEYPWIMRYSLICGYECLTDQCTEFLISIDPHGSSFYIYPLVDADHAVVLRWETTKANFADGDTVSFDNPVVEAVAFYVKSEIIREVDKDVILAESYMESFRKKRTVLYLDTKDRQHMKA